MIKSKLSQIYLAAVKRTRNGKQEFARGTVGTRKNWIATTYVTQALAGDFSDSLGADMKYSALH